MDRIIKEAIAKAECTDPETRVGWLFGNLKEEMDALHSILIAHVVRTPNRGFDGWMYYERDHVPTRAAIDQMQEVLTAFLELLRVLRLLE